jgi:hypothetical protein
MGAHVGQALRSPGSDPGPNASLDLIVRVTGPKLDVRFSAAFSSSTRTLCPAASSAARQRPPADIAIPG